MQEKEHPLTKWFGERKIVRLMLLAALLLWRVASPLLLGAAMAYILEIIIKRLEKILFPRTKNAWLNKSRRGICILLATVLVISLVVLIVFTVIPGLTDAFTLLSRELPNYFTQFEAWLQELFKDVPAVKEYLDSLDLEWDAIQEKIVNWALNGATRGTLLSSTVTVIGVVTGQITNFFISCIFAIFLLGSKAQLSRQYHSVMRAAASEKTNRRVQRVLTAANHCFSGFIVGQSVNGLVMGILTWLGMRIFGMPYALMVGVLSGTTSLIPIIGGYIGAALGTFLVFTAAPSMALWFLLFIVALQNLQGNVIYPRLVGNSIGLPSLWVLAAVSVGGGLGGIGGIMLAVPLTATMYALAHEWVQKKQAQEKAA